LLAKGLDVGLSLGKLLLQSGLLLLQARCFLLPGLQRLLDGLDLFLALANLSRVLVSSLSNNSRFLRSSLSANRMTAPDRGRCQPGWSRYPVSQAVGPFDPTPIDIDGRKGEQADQQKSANDNEDTRFIREQPSGERSWVHGMEQLARHQLPAIICAALGAGGKS